MNRDLRIDFLRFLGLSLVILAHVQAPFVLTQIRSFDVPLMVFVSGLTASTMTEQSYLKYIWKRTKRLIIPVWLFLAVYLSLFYFTQHFLLAEPYLTGRMIVRSFLLLDDSIGYVWIIRVFLLIMIVTPPIVKLSRFISSDILYVSIVLALMLLNQIAFQWSVIIPDGLVKKPLVDIIIYGLAYSIPFAIGVRVREAKNKTLWLYIILFLFLLFLLCFNCFKHGGNPLGISMSFKFPPRPYFIVYGVFVSLVLWLTKNWWGGIANNKITTFIGQNTIWIYLWHMPMALIATVFMHNWIIKYLFVYGSALFVFCVQYYTVKKINNKTLNRYLLG